MSLIKQITAERDYLAQQVWHIYQPSQVGDYFRWDIKTAIVTGYVRDCTYPAIASIVRGSVYAGARKRPTDYDAQTGAPYDSGWTGPQGDAKGLMGFDFATFDDVGETRTFNIPGGLSPTHARVWFYCIGGSAGSCDITFLDAADATLLVSNYAIGGRTLTVQPCAWIAIPANTAKIKLVLNGSFFVFCGLDWINTSSIVTPDTAGSMMFDGLGGNTKTVSGSDGWGQNFTADATELAVFWDVDGGSFSSAKCVGGLAHRGIRNDTGTVVWTKQSGVTAPEASDILGGAFATYKGQKEKADFVILTLTDLSAYNTANDYANIKGTVQGQLIFDVSGCFIYHKLTATANMDVFQSYSVQLGMASDINYVYFGGDPTKHVISTSTVVSEIGSSVWICGGGSNKIIYTIFIPDPGLVTYYYQSVKPHVYMSGGAKPKIYGLLYDYQQHSGTPMNLNIGSSIETRFRVNLADTGAIAVVNCLGGLIE